MSTTNTNVVTGCGVPYIATEGTALPTITGTLASSITWATWTQAAWNENDFELNFNYEYDKFKPAGEVSEVLANLARIGLSGKLKLAESDADAFKLALSTSAISSAVTSDGGAAAVVYWGLAIQTPLLVYHIKRVVFNIDGSVALDDEKRTVIPVSFDAYLRKGDTAGQQLFRIHERT